MKNSDSTRSAVAGAAVLAAMLGGFAGAAPAQSPTTNGFTAFGPLPQARQTMISPVTDADRNPFVSRLVKKATVVEDRDAQETKIRSVLSTMEVKGTSKGKNGVIVLMGPLVLEEGAEVPQLIENQTQKLIVTKVKSTEVELTWVDEPGVRRAEEGPRKFIKSFNLKPKVGKKLITTGTIVEPSDKKRIPAASTTAQLEQF